MPPRDATTSPTAPPSIVFADNDALVLEVIGDLLRSKGYNVHVAEDGLAAWERIRYVRPTYVILDVVMPKLDGSQVCWLMRQDPTLRETPIIVFSSLGAQDFRHFPSLSADAYVAKGEFAAAFQHLVAALAHIQAKGRTDLAGGIFGYDATRPRELVAELLLEVRRYQSLLDALGPGTIELDPDGKILRTSTGACKILGRRETQVLGESVTALCSARDQATLQQLLRELTTATRPDRCRAVVRFGEREVPIQLCSLMQEGRCTGVLLIMESADTPDAAARETCEGNAGPAEGPTMGEGPVAGSPEKRRTQS
jgi:PAS domain S-box-containing protein